MVFFSGHLTVMSQTLRAFLTAAEQAFYSGDYYSALKYYETALEFDDSNIQLWYQLGESARSLQLIAEQQRAYEKVLELMPDNKNTDQYNCAYAYLGESYVTSGDLEKAEYFFRQFLQSDDLSECREKAEKGLANLAFIRTNASLEKNIVITRLEHEVNTPWSEIAPLPLENSLIFTSFRSLKGKRKNLSPRSVIMQSENGQAAGRLSEEINNFEPDKNIGHTTFSRDRSRIYFSVCDQEDPTLTRGCAIYFSDRDASGKWDKPLSLHINGGGFDMGLKNSSDIKVEGLKIRHNTPTQLGWTTTQPNIGLDPITGEEVLYFVSNRPGSMEGSLDLWKCVINEGVFGIPENLEQLNTSDDEITPFFDQQSSTLYFSSTGYPGFGGFDIFAAQSDRGGNQGWLSPINLGTGWNSGYDDLYFTTDKEGFKSYFASNRPSLTFIDPILENEPSTMDIFLVVLEDKRRDLIIEVKNMLTGINTKEVSITLKDVTEDESEILYKGTTNNGNAYVPGTFFTRNRRYELIVEMAGMEPSSQFFDFSNIDPNDGLPEKLNLYYTPSSIIQGLAGQKLPVYFPDLFENGPQKYRPTTRKNSNYQEDYERLRGFCTNSDSREELKNFYENEVNSSYDELNQLAQELIKYLAEWDSLALNIQVFSDFSEEDQKEVQQSMKESLFNFFYHVQEGALQQYLDDGRLRFEETGPNIKDHSRWTKTEIMEPVDEANQQYYSPGYLKKQRIEISFRAAN